jgi:hypothetical protein
MPLGDLILSDLPQVLVIGHRFGPAMLIDQDHGKCALLRQIG